MHIHNSSFRVPDPEPPDIVMVGCVIACVCGLKSGPRHLVTWQEDCYNSVTVVDFLVPRATRRRWHHPNAVVSWKGKAFRHVACFFTFPRAGKTRWELILPLVCVPMCAGSSLCRATAISCISCGMICIRAGLQDALGPARARWVPATTPGAPTICHLMCSSRRWSSITNSSTSAGRGTRRRREASGAGRAEARPKRRR